MFRPAVVFFVSCEEDLNTTVNPSKEIEKVDLPHVDGQGQILKFTIPSLENCNVVLEDFMYRVEGWSGTDDTNLQIWVTRNMDQKTRRGKILFNFENGEKKTYTLEQDILANEDLSGPVETKSRFGVGYGVDLSQEFSTKAICGEVFQVENMYNQKLIIKDTSTQETELSDYSGETKREVGHKITIKAGGKGEFAGYSAEAKAAFSMENTQSVYNQYAILAFSSSKGIYKIDPSIVDYASHMTQNAIKSINDASLEPYDLFKHFGTHVVMSAHEGARFNYDMTLDREKMSSSVSISAFAKAGFKNKFAEVNVEVTNEATAAYKANKEKCKTKSRTVGGPENSSDLINAGNFKEWMAQIKEDNWAMIGFVNQNSLRPIWEFATDPARREALKEATIAYINSQWEPEKKKTIKIEIPEFESKGTLVKTVRVDGVPYAEICNEYIPEISRLERQIILYPINPATGKIDYTMGFFIGNANSKPSWIMWGDKKINAIKPIDEYPMGRMKSLYACGKNFAPYAYGDIASSTTDNEYSHCDFADNANIALVKLGTDIFARDNTYFNKTRREDGFVKDNPMENCSNSASPIEHSIRSFFWSGKDSPRYYGYKFAHRSPILNDNENLWRPIGFNELNQAEDFIGNDKTRWLVGGIAGLDLKFEGYLWDKTNARQHMGEEDLFWFGRDMSQTVVYKENGRRATILRPSFDDYKKHAGSFRFMRSKTFYYQ